MTANIFFQGESYSLQDGETVLECLLRNGKDVSYSCKNGVCQSCLMHSTQGEPTKESQLRLKDSLKAQNFFLACQCRPNQDMGIETLNVEKEFTKGIIYDKEMLCHNVVAIHIKPLADIEARPGQYINLMVEGVVRSYSIANLSNKDGVITLHIRKIANGIVSSWAHDKAKTGDSVLLRGGMGDCFYLGTNNENSFPILLAGTGTGLAPLEAIVLDALDHGHKGKIHIIHGGLKPSDLYHMEKLQSLADSYENLSYTPCVLNKENSVIDIYEGSLDAIVNSAVSTADKINLRAYFCGAPEMVNLLKKNTFIAGVSSKHIFSDPFLQKHT